MILDAADLIAATLDSLPPFDGSLALEHFIEGTSAWALARRHRMKRRDVEARLESALAIMRRDLARRGVRGIWDVI